jgi:UDP-N-acetylglucosamine 4,6-dehydratase
MCPADDSHLMFEFADHYMVNPSIKFTRVVDLTVNRRCGRGQPVEQGYEFHSGHNLKYFAVGEIPKFNEQEMDQA